MPDYTSTLDIARPSGDRRTAEQWARAVWEQAPAPVRIFLRLGWRCLGLRGRSAPQRVLGWRVAESVPERVVLDIPSRIMTARNVIRLDERKVRWTTDVDFDRAPARLLWCMAAPMHQRLIPAQLRRAARTTRPGDRRRHIVTTFQRRLGNRCCPAYPARPCWRPPAATPGCADAPRSAAAASATSSGWCRSSACARTTSATSRQIPASACACAGTGTTASPIWSPRTTPGFG